MHDSCISMKYKKAKPLRIPCPKNDLESFCNHIVTKINTPNLVYLNFDPYIDTWLFEIIFLYRNSSTVLLLSKAISFLRLSPISNQNFLCILCLKIVILYIMLRFKRKYNFKWWWHQEFNGFWQIYCIKTTWNYFLFPLKVG